MTDSPTVHVAIGNSDDGLTQAEWSAFHNRTDEVIRREVARFGGTVHGAWSSVSTAPFQNAAWAFSAEPAYGGPGVSMWDHLRWCLGRVAVQYRQDSIAWNESVTEFLTPGTPRPGARVGAEDAAAYVAEITDGIITLPVGKTLRNGDTITFTGPPLSLADGGYPRPNRTDVPNLYGIPITFCLDCEHNADDVCVRQHRTVHPDRLHPAWEPESVPDGGILYDADTWQQIHGITVKDPDGWRDAGVPWDRRITEARFLALCANSTVDPRVNGTVHNPWDKACTATTAHPWRHRTAMCVLCKVKHTPLTNATPGPKPGNLDA